MQRHVEKYVRYSLPSDLHFAEAGPAVQTEANEVYENIHEGNPHSILEQMPAVMWTTDLELSLNSFAGNGVARLHQDMHPFVGMSLSDFFNMDSDATPTITAHLKALDGHAQSFEFSHGDAFFSGTVEPLFNADGNLMGTVGALVDITARHHAEQDRLRQQARRFEADRRQGLTDLARHLSQHFNDLFSAVSGYAAIARIGLDPENPLQWCLGEIEKAAQCAVDLIDPLASPPETELTEHEPVDLSQLIKDQLQTFQAFLARTITLQCDLAPETAAVAGDAKQLRRLLVNLLFNAAAANGLGKGAISLRTQITSGPPSVLLDQEDGSRLPEGDYVWLQVSDTGRGLDMDAKARIFEPFAGFAAPGIGLSIAKAIVAAHHGAITISSKPGLGTTCHVLLPAMQHHAEVLPPENFF